MATEKACKNCRTIFEGHQCPKCNSTETSDNFKGKVHILKAEESEIAKNLNVKDKGSYAIKL